MGDGYVRQSAADIVTGEVVEAGPLNAEFNQIRDAFHETSGHSHDGTTGEGPKLGLETSVSGVLPVANGGIAGIHKLDGTTAPTANDDNSLGYAVGSKWIDITNDRAYICVDATNNTAVWLFLGTTVGWQPLDASLTAYANLTTAANKGIYFTAADTPATFDLTAAGRALLDDADADAQLVTLGLTATASELNKLDGATVTTAEINYLDGVTSDIQTQLNAKQPLDGDLTALAALSGTDTIYYRSGSSTWTAVTIGSGLSFSSGTLSADALGAELSAIAGLTSAADRLPYFTGSGTAALATFPSFGRTLVANTTAADARVDLELVIGTDVQAYHATLASVAGGTYSGDDNIVTVGTLSAGNATAIVDAASTTAAGKVELATAAEFRTGTDTTRALGVDETWDAAAEVTLTDASTITVDMASFINAVVTLEDNRTLGNPTNTRVGQSGVIRIVQDGTGSRTLAYGTSWEFAGGTAPTLSTGANDEDLLFYHVISSTRIFASLVQDIS